MKLTTAQLLWFCVFLSPVVPAHADLIVNGDFELTTISGTVPFGWVSSGGNPVNPLAFQHDPVVPAASGTWALDLGPAGPDELNGGSISQSFTVAVARSYVFRFLYSNEFHDPVDFADFSWSLEGAVVDSGSLLDIGGGYKEFTRVYSINTPGNITVTFNDIVGQGDQWDAIIDDVSFTALGDVNRDGSIDLLDVSPFVELLIEGIYQPEADVNVDGEVNLLDVGPFVDLLIGS